MAANSDEVMDSLLSAFDQIYQDVKGGISEIQLLQSNCAAESRKREALEINCSNLKSENERLANLYTESLKNLADQLDFRTKCMQLKEEIERASNELLYKEDEHRKDMELFKKEYEAKIENLEAEIKASLGEKATYETTVNQLHQDLAAHKNHTQVLANRLDQMQFEVESKYSVEIQDLKECLLIEQEEKNELNRRIQSLEKEYPIPSAIKEKRQKEIYSY